MYIGFLIKIGECASSVFFGDTKIINPKWAWADRGGVLVISSLWLHIGPHKGSLIERTTP